MLNMNINQEDQMSMMLTLDGEHMFSIGEGDMFWVEAGFIEQLRPSK